MKMKKKPRAVSAGEVSPTSKHANKRNGAALEADRAEMIRLMRRGWTQAMIADRMGLSRQQITYDYRIVLKEMAEERTEGAKELVAMTLERLAEVAAEAWAEWDRSKQDRSKREEAHQLSRPPIRPNGRLKRGQTTAQALAVKMQHVRTTLTTERHLGDPRYLEIILAATREAARLQGLYPAKAIDLTTSVAWTWEGVFGLGDAKRGVDPVEVALRERPRPAPTDTGSG
jgi:hypothetical protein